ncbi:hypothetical protein OG389_00610 [Streptomyces sp. NBC_00435]|uniref:hypothetical protein n=1 Tax=Streptomyces sp. NBC_00435 TaxID=2903649 RepID=UPI002E217D5A
MTGTKNSASAGVYVPADRVDITEPGRTKLNDYTTGTGTNQFEFVGAWSKGAQDDAWQKDNHWSGTAATDYYQVRFKGTKANLYGAMAPNHGIAAVSIDGGPETNVDFYAPTRMDNILAWSSPVLGAGSHTLKVRATGNKNNSTTSPGGYIPGDRVDVFP